MTAASKSPLGSLLSAVPALRLWRGLGLLAVLAVVTLIAQFLAAPGQGAIVAALLRWTPAIATGFALNIAMSVIAMAAGTVTGGWVGILQISPRKPVRQAAWLLTEFFRNAPWIVLLFYCMFLLPFQITIGGVTIPLPGWFKATLGLSASVMGNVSEIVRGGIQALPSAQWEAAESLGFSRWATLWRIILPQCVKPMLPPWMNLYSLLIMSTPLASIVGVNDAMAITQSAISAEGRPELMAPMYLYLLAFFFVYSYPISLWTMRLERRYRVRT